MALALILFCVFQVMTALSNVTATSSLPSLLPNTTLLVAGDMATDPEDKHGKRSLNAYPFEHKYIGTETMTLEILDNGTVRGVKTLTPSYGIMQFTMACMMHTIIPSFDKNEHKNYGKVSLKWEKSEHYLCMNYTGKVYGSRNCTDDCEFKQEIENNDHHLLYSLKYSGPRPGKKILKTKNGRLNKKRRKKWYLAINRKSGDLLPGWRTRKRKKHAHFLPRPTTDHGYKETRYSITTTSDPNVIPKVSLDPKGSVSVQVNTDQVRDNVENFFIDPTSQGTKPTERQNHEPKTKRGRKNKDRSHRRRHKQGTKRAQDCDQRDKDPLNLFRLNCGRKVPRNTKNLRGSVLFSSTAFSNENSRGSTSNPAQRRTSRANLFSFSPKR